MIQGRSRAAAVLLLSAAWAGVAAQEPPVTYKSAVVALAEDPELRAEFETGLAAKARAHDYDAITSFDIVPDAERLDDRRLGERLAAQGIRMVLMAYPAAVGEGATLESVRESVPEETYRDMRAFARRVSPTGNDDTLAVVHMAIYVLDDGDPRLVSSGAVWLNEEVESREQGMDRLQDLIVANVNLVRPKIREHLGLPPLE